MAGTWACPHQPGESESLPSSPGDFSMSVTSGGPEPGIPATMHRNGDCELLTGKSLSFADSLHSSE